MNGGEKQTLTSRELADILGVSESSVKRWVDSGEIEAIRTDGGHRRIAMAAAVRYIRSRRAAPARPALLPLASPPALGRTDADAAERLYRALLNDDLGAARSLIQGRYLSGAGVAEIADELIRPVLGRVGELWRSRDEGILIEHRAVDSCVQVLSELQGWIPAPRRTAPVAITAAGPGDPYLLPPMLASLCLRERGIASRNLGPLTPLETMLVAARRYKASLCCVSVSIEPDKTAHVLWKQSAGALRDAGVALVLGGRYAGSLRGVLDNSVRVCEAMSELAEVARGAGTRAPRPGKARGRAARR